MNDMKLSGIFGGQVRGCKTSESNEYPQELRPTNIPVQEHTKAEVNESKMSEMFGGHVKGLDKNEINHMFPKSMKPRGKTKMESPFKSKRKDLDASTMLGLGDNKNKKQINASSMLGMNNTKGKKMINVSGHLGSGKQKKPSFKVDKYIGSPNKQKKHSFNINKYITPSKKQSGSTNISKFIGNTKQNIRANQNKVMMGIVKRPDFIAQKRSNQQKGLSMFGDFDGDKLPNILDCDPRDKNKQGAVHDWLKEKAQKAQEVLQLRKRMEGTEIKQTTGYQSYGVGERGPLTQLKEKTQEAGAAVVDTGQGLAKISGQDYRENIKPALITGAKATGEFLRKGVVDIGETGRTIGEAAYEKGREWAPKIEAGAKQVGKGLQYTFLDVPMGTRKEDVSILGPGGKPIVMEKQVPVLGPEGKPLLDTKGKVITTTEQVPATRSVEEPFIHKGLLSRTAGGIGTAVGTVVGETKELFRDVGAAQEARRAESGRRAEALARAETDIAVEQLRVQRLGPAYGYPGMGATPQQQMFGGAGERFTQQLGFGAREFQAGIGAVAPPQYPSRIDELIGMSRPTTVGVRDAYEMVRLGTPGQVEKPYGMKVQEALGGEVIDMAQPIQQPIPVQPMVPQQIPMQPMAAQQMMPQPVQPPQNGVVVEGTQYKRLPSGKYLNIKTGKTVTYPRGRYEKKSVAQTMAAQPVGVPQYVQ